VPRSQDFQHRLETEDIGVHPKAGDEAFGYVREDAVDAAFGNIADMDFDVRQARPLNAILQRKAGIGKPCRIHHQSVEALVYGPIDSINRLAFDVAIENVEDVVMLPGVMAQHGIELGGCCRAVDRGFAPPEEGQIRARGGALSAPAGRVSIERKIDRLDGGGTFTFVWRETGGPAMTKPTRKGFGSVILLDSAKHFGQTVELDYMPRGLCYELQVQLNKIEASKQTNGPARIGMRPVYPAAACRPILKK
jgi:hypothetical protein